MRILLLNPPFKDSRFSRESRSPAVSKGGTIYYPMWLAYATGVLEEAGHVCRLVDAPANGLGEQDVLDCCAEFQPQMVVFNTTTPSIVSDADLATRVKERWDNTTVFVGTHPSALPEETLRLSGAIDIIARREYDYTLRHLAQALQSRESLTTVEGVSFRHGATVHHNPDRPPIEDVDSLPLLGPVYKRHLNHRKYFFAAAQYPVMQIMTGRGCNYRCIWCVYPQVFHRPGYRKRSAARIVQEFEYIVTNFPDVKEIGIEDDTFTTDEARVIEFCELLMERKLRIDWYVNARVSLSCDTMRMMKRAGCRLLIVGYESGNQHVLNSMKKGITLKQSREFTRAAKETGFIIHGCMMAGNPGETVETLQQTLDFARELNVDTMQFLPVMLYPGTEAYEWARAHGYLRNESFDQWVTETGMHRTLVDLPDLSAEELVKWCDYARRAYYLRPRYLLRKLWQGLTKPSEMERTLRSFRVFIGPLLLGTEGLQGIRRRFRRE